MRTHTVQSCDIVRYLLSLEGKPVCFGRIGRQSRRFDVAIMLSWFLVIFITLLGFGYGK